MMWEVHSLGYVTSQTVLALMRIKDLPRVPEIYRNYRITGWMDRYSGITATLVIPTGDQATAEE